MPSTPRHFFKPAQKFILDTGILLKLRYYRSLIGLEKILLYAIYFENCTGSHHTCHNTSSIGITHKLIP